MKCQNFYVNFIYQVVLHLLHINLDTHNTPLLARSVERQILDNIRIKKSYPVPWMKLIIRIIYINKCIMWPCFFMSILYWILLSLTKQTFKNHTIIVA